MSFKNIVCFCLYWVYLIRIRKSYAHSHKTLMSPISVTIVKALQVLNDFRYCECKKVIK
jgi:hypothetical protein